MFKKKDEDKVEEEILQIVESGQEQGVFEEAEAEMISNVLDFDDKYVRDVMTSRSKICAVEKSEKIGDVLRTSLESSFSRFPVYDGDIDNIKGVMHFKDLVSAYLKDPDAEVMTIMDEAMFVHPTLHISKLLRMMQTEKSHMAVVIDEYGQTDGIATLEDIIEEIVGNIEDEHDDEESQIKKRSDGEIIVDGMMSLNDLGELLTDIEFPENDIETLNGFILYRLGRFPERSEDIKIDYGGYTFKPLDVQDNIIKVVRITKTNS